METTIEKYIHIEEDFEHCGYRCIVLVNAACLRCGYVGVPKSHPDYKKDYMDIEEKYDVHGGLTFSDWIENIWIAPDDLWYFGFDCGHFYDMHAVEDALRYGINVDAKTAEMFTVLNKMLKEYDNTLGIGKPNDCSKEYVKQECISLAEQLKKEDNNGR